MGLGSPEDKAENPSVQTLIKKRTYRSSAESVRLIKGAVLAGEPCSVIRFGPMLAEKTLGVLFDVFHLESVGYRVHVFKFSGDNRYGIEVNLVGSASGYEHYAIAVSDIDEIAKRIQSRKIVRGDVIAIVEFPFICPDVEKLISFI